MSTGLGRGLSSLIPPKQNKFSPQAQQAAGSEMTQLSTDIEIVKLALTDVEPNPMQPRQHFDTKTLEELANSIAQYGLLEPIVVTPHEGKFQIVAGERRYRAHKLLQKKYIHAIVRSASELERLELALIENIQRQDLNPMEKANSYAHLVNEFGLTQEEAAKKLGIARSSLANSIRLLDLPTEIQRGLAQQLISEGHAKVLLGLETEVEQLAVYKELISGGVGSVRSLSEKVSSKGGAKKRRSIVDHEVQSLQDEVQTALGTKVQIKKKSSGGYQILIDTFSPEEFKSVIKKIT